MHTNGSWAAEDYVTALEKAVAAHPEITDTRDCAIHGQMMERQHIERLVGDYSKLDATKDTELSGTAVDPALRAALQDGELMKKQNLVNSTAPSTTHSTGATATWKYSWVPAAPRI